MARRTSPRHPGGADPGRAGVPRAAGDPERVGRWRVLGRLAPGSGTMVYRVTDDRGVEAALKTVAPDAAAHGRRPAGAVAQRLHHEAALLRLAATDGVAGLREDASDATVPHLVLELVTGPSVRELAARTGPLPQRQVALLGTLVAATLGRVHELGVAHGDVKPANVLCADAGPVLLDFDAAARVGVVGAADGPAQADDRAGAGGLDRIGAGLRLARLLPASRAAAGAATTSATARVAPDDDRTLPMGGSHAHTAARCWGTTGAPTRRRGARRATVRVTPRWIAPERVGGAPASPAADVFALGGMLVYLATGRPPFGDGSAAELLERVVSSPPQLDLLPGGLRPALEACLAKDPAARPTAAELSKELTAATTARRRPVGSRIVTPSAATTRSGAPSLAA